MDGEEVNLICICKAKPLPVINWLRKTLMSVDEYQPVMFTNDIKSFFDSSTGKCTLRISDVFPQDAGTYICTVSNTLGTAETRTKLTVECNIYNT